MGKLRNIAVFAGGIWVGDMVGTAVLPMIPLPKGPDGNVNPTVVKVGSLLITATVAYYALHFLGHRSKKG